MNLYDYSQVNNVEMGILITKKDDEEAYKTLIEEINNIKVNGVRKKFDSLNVVEDPAKVVSVVGNGKESEKQVSNTTVLTSEQKLKFQILKEWRLNKSRYERTGAFSILSDDEIKSIVTANKLDFTKLYEILPKRKVISFGKEILDNIDYTSGFTIGKVVGVWYQDNSNSYDRVKLRILKTGEEKWFDTTYELPTKDRLVAVKINKNWFNDYLYLDDY